MSEVRVFSVLRWTPLSHPKLDWLGATAVAARIQTVLESWRGTGYMSGAQTRGTAADCVGFLCGALDELCGLPTCPREELPPDAALHSKEDAEAAMRRIIRRYEPLERRFEPEVEPGDVLVVGPSGGGPGHGMIVGSNPGEVWHCNGRSGVCTTGLVTYSEMGFYRCFRILRKHLWLPH